MSSILDSLKKLEKETAQQEQLLTHAGVDGKAPVSKYVSVIGVICLFVGAIGLTVYYKGAPGKSSETPAKRTVLAAKSAAPQDDQEDQSTPSQDRPAPLPEKLTEKNALAVAAPEERKPDPVLEAQPMPAEKTSPKKDTIPEPAKEDVLKEPPKEEPVAEISLQESAPEKPAVQDDTPSSSNDVSPEAPETEQEPIQIDRLEGVGFKIQAISWSEAPEQSLAVINSQVLREGDGIEGYQITRINPDDIVLQRDGKAFRLEFRSTGSP